MAGSVHQLDSYGIFQATASARCWGSDSGLTCHRYFLRKLRKIKKAHGQVLAVNEVSLLVSDAVDVLLDHPLLRSDANSAGTDL